MMMPEIATPSSLIGKASPMQVGFVCTINCVIHAFSHPCTMLKKFCCFYNHCIQGHSSTLISYARQSLPSHDRAFSAVCPHVPSPLFPPPRPRPSFSWPFTELQNVPRRRDVPVSCSLSQDSFEWEISHLFCSPSGIVLLSLRATDFDLHSAGENETTWFAVVVVLSCVKGCVIPAPRPATLCHRRAGFMQ